MPSSYFIPLPEDFDVRRAELGLGLRGAARYYNELVAPGIGGAWRVRHLSWAVAGLALHGAGARRSPTMIAHGVEALGNKVSWSEHPDRSRARLRGRRAFERTPDQWAFEQLARRTYYVQVTHRQQVTRALPDDTGLHLTEGSTRYNAMRLSSAGHELAGAFLEQRVPNQGQPALRKVLRDWMARSFDPSNQAGRLRPLLSPDEATPDERAIVRRRLRATLSRNTELGRRDPERRARLIDVVTSNPDAGVLDALLAQGGESHVLDIRAARAFDHMRAAAVAVLQEVALAVREQDRPRVSALAARPEIAEAIVRLRSAATEYTRQATLCGPLRADLAAFTHRMASGDAALIAGLVERDGRVLILAGDHVARGALFRTELGARGEEDDEAPDEDVSGLPHRRLGQFVALWRSCAGT